MTKGYFGLLLVTSLALACGDSTSPPVPSRVVVTPISHKMTYLGENVQYSARLEGDKGREMSDVVFNWTTSDPSLATISSSGLATGVKAGIVSVAATAEGTSGFANLTLDQVPKKFTKVSGDEQPGILNQVLPENPTVEVLDVAGSPVEGKVVTFSVVAGGGTITPWQVQTDSDGRASAVWQLGCSNDNPQRLNATISRLWVSFTADVDLAALAICEDTVPDGRETLSYSTVLSAVGGDQNTLTWSLKEGDLPPGLTLQPGGELSGIPTLAGTFPFEARVQDGQGGSASALYDFHVCDGPVLLAAGESRAFSPSGPDGCGFFLPSGENGDRYRFGVVYTPSDDENPWDVPGVTVAMAKEVGGGLSSQPFFSSQATGADKPALGPRLELQESQALQDALILEASNQEFQRRLRADEWELIRSFGPHARPLPDTRGLSRSSGPALASPDKVSFTNSWDFNTSCYVKETVRAIKVKENDVMVIYQDSIQRASSDALSDTHAQWMLDFYAANGPQVIDAYFGGITDINADGKVVVFVTPVVKEGTVAFVWSGDFFPKTPQGEWAGCAASNEMEMMRFSLQAIRGMDAGGYQPLGTMVHEVKHISSLYKSLIRGEGQPLWIEEGTAEIAKEVASRIAWARVGGPAVGARADSSHVDRFTRENYGIILVVAGTTGYLSSQPNGVVVSPKGASDRHSVHGSGWHFHRWLGDAYGNAATPLGDASLFRALNNSTTAAGIQGILNVTGAGSWAELLEEYLTAIMLNETGAPQGNRAFTSYDFLTMNLTFTYDGKPSGDYPWPVNVFGGGTTGSFVTSSNVGPIGPSGVRIFDLTSDGSGLGLEVKVTAAAVSPFRIVLVRVE